MPPPENGWLTQLALRAHALFALPQCEADLLRHYTLNDEDLQNIGGLAVPPGGPSHQPPRCATFGCHEWEITDCRQHGEAAEGAELRRTANRPESTIVVWCVRCLHGP